MAGPLSPGSPASVVVVGGAGVLSGLCLIWLTGLPAQWIPFAALVPIGLLAAVTVGNARKLLLAAILLEQSLELDINLLYNEGVADLGGIAGINLSLATGAIAVLYTLWFTDALVFRKTSDGPGLWRPTLPLFAYVTVVAASVIGAQDRLLAIFEVATLLQMLLLYVYLLNNIRTRKDVEFVVTVLVVGLLLQGLIFVALLGVGGSFGFATILASIDEDGRYTGTLSAANYAGAYLSLVMAVSLGVFLSDSNRRRKLVALSAASLGGIALLLTGSRGGWLAFGLAALVLCIGAWRRGSLSPLVPAALALGGVFFAVVFQGMVAERLFPEDQSAISGRIPLMSLAIRMIADNPVFGIGANNFAIRIEDYATAVSGLDWLYVVHNKYLLVWSEAGPVALVFFLMFLIMALRSGWKVWRWRDPYLSPVALGLTAGLLGHMLHMNVESFNGRGAVELLWIVAAVLVAMGRTPRETAR